mgnify:CR=1 FL=1
MNIERNENGDEHSQKITHAQLIYYIDGNFTESVSMTLLSIIMLF